MTIDKNTRTQIAVNIMVPMTVMLDRNRLTEYADSIRKRWEEDLQAFSMEDLLIQAKLDGNIDIPDDWDVNDADYSEEMLSMDDLEVLGYGK